MQDWEERLIYEEGDMTIKLMKLRRFMRTSEYAVLLEQEQKAMVEQRDAMKAYIQALRVRLALLTEEI